MPLRSGRFLFAILVFSLVLNLLTLASPIFMMQVYDRVMPSHSVPTLLALLVLVAALQGMQSLISHIRGHVLRRYAAHTDAVLEEAAFEETVSPQNRARTWRGENSPLQNLSDRRAFITGNGLAALFDIPWALVFAAVMFLLHPWLGLVALVFAAAIGLLSIAAEVLRAEAPGINDRATLYRDPFRDELKTQTIRGCGLSGRFRDEWLSARSEGRSSQARAQVWPETVRTMARGLRNIQGSAILALAAYLTLENMATFGVMMASSIIAGRISGPIDACISSWRDIRSTWRSRTQLKALADLAATKSDGADLPLPTRMVEALSVSVGTGDARALSSVSLKLVAGDALGVTGATGAGKSTLINVLAGAVTPRSGKVKYDGADRRAWREEIINFAIGYLPQDAIFFDGTIAQNIARFDQDISHEAVLDAARAIGIHDTIDRMPLGYDTEIQKSGREFSAGLRVKLGLARALYRQPFLLLLDNPTAALDRDGELKLLEYLKAHKARGGILVMATTQAAALMMVDRVVVLANGRIASAGSREELFRPLLADQPPQKLAVVPANEPHAAGGA